jgi:hypothetical protein
LLDILNSSLEKLENSKQEGYISKVIGYFKVDSRIDAINECKKRVLQALQIVASFSNTLNWVKLCEMKASLEKFEIES